MFSDSCVIDQALKLQQRIRLCRTPDIACQRVRCLPRWGDLIGRQNLRLATQHLVKLHCEPTLFGELTNLSRAGAEVEINGDRNLDVDAQTMLELLERDKPYRPLLPGDAGGQSD